MFLLPLEVVVVVLMLSDAGTRLNEASLLLGSGFEEADAVAAVAAEVFAGRVDEDCGVISNKESGTSATASMVKGNVVVLNGEGVNEDDDDEADCGGEEACAVEELNEAAREEPAFADIPSCLRKNMADKGGNSKNVRTMISSRMVGNCCTNANQLTNVSVADWRNPGSW